MAGRADTKALGLHGLFIEARRRNDRASAQAYAEEAARTRAGARLGRPGGAGSPLQRPATGPVRCCCSSSNKRDARQGDLSPPARGAAHRARACARRDRPRQRQGLRARSGETRADFGAGGGARRAAPRRGRPAAQGKPHHRQRLARQSASRTGPGLCRASLRRMPRATGSSASRRWRNRVPGHIEGALAMARAAIDAQEFAKARRRARALSADADETRVRC